MFDDKRKSDILSLMDKNNVERVLIQVPEGLKKDVQDLADFLEEHGIESYISIEPCFGACDLRDHDALSLGCDALLHIGHRDMGIETRVPVIYYEYPVSRDLVSVVKPFMKNINFKKVCLVTTLQFEGGLEKVREYMKRKGLDAFVGGSILGCDVSAAKKFEKEVEAFVFIGSGRFHPLGLRERVSKPVIFIDLENNSLENLSADTGKAEIRKEMKLQKAREFRNFAVLLSTKPGQRQVGVARRLRRKLDSLGKSVHILVADRMTPDKLLGLNVDVLVNTSCPRLTGDNEQFGKIILDAEDVDSL